MQGGIQQDKIVYKDLSYRIMGVMFEVYNDLGYGLQEKYYQKATELALLNKGIKYKSQVPYKIRRCGEIVGRYFIDLIIEDKIVIELKKGDYYSRKNFEQVTAYLKVTNMKLAIIVNFTSKGVKYKRIVNIT